MHKISDSGWNPQSKYRNEIFPFLCKAKYGNSPRVLLQSLIDPSCLVSERYFSFSSLLGAIMICSKFNGKTKNTTIIIYNHLPVSPFHFPSYSTENENKFDDITKN